jgi:hypothetical protein
MVSAIDKTIMCGNRRCLNIVVLLGITSAAIAAASAAFCIARFFMYQLEISNPMPSAPSKTGNRRPIMTAMPPRSSAEKRANDGAFFSMLTRCQVIVFGMVTHLRLAMPLREQHHNTRRLLITFSPGSIEIH